MTTTIKITELTNIGANLASSTVIPVVNMAGTPTTEKTVLGNIANVVLAGAGGNYVAAAKANTATTANTVLTNAQPNITSVGTLSNVTVSGNASINGNITSNGTSYLGNISTTGYASITTLTVGSSANLGAVGNVRITGGTNGQVLTTNGSGNLSWTTVSSGSNGTPGGSNTQIQFNDAGSFGGNTGFTFDKTTGIFTSPFVAGNGNGLSNIQGANISGFVPNANIANTAYSVAVANVSGLGNIATANFDGNASNVLHGDGSWSADTTTYGNSNVVTLLSSFGSNTITTTGNVSVGNIIATNIGNISSINKDGNASNVLLGNGVFGGVPGSTPASIANGNSNVNIANGNGNVTITSNGTRNWTFDTTGNLTTAGDLIGPANANFTIHSNASVHEFIFGSNGTFYAPDNVVLGGNSIYIGPGANTLAGIEHEVLLASSNNFAYVQGVINNISDNGSAEWVALGARGNDAGGWGEVGFTSSGFGDANYTITGGGDGYVFAQSYAPGQTLLGGGGNLVLATGNQGSVKDIIFGTGGFLTSNIFGRISHANNSLEISRTGASLKFPDGSVQTTAYTGGAGSELVNGDNSFVLDVDGNVVFEGNVAGQAVQRGLVWDYGANANGVNSMIRQDNNGLTVRAWTENGGNYTAPVNIITGQDANTNTWIFDGNGNLTVPSGSINSISDAGSLGAYLTLNPDLGLARLAGRGALANVGYTTADWTSATYTGTQIDFTNAPDLVTFFNNNRFNDGVNQTFSINGDEPVPFTGYTIGVSNAVTVYTSVTASPDPTTVTSINFYYQLESYVSVDYDDGSLNINATGLTIYLDNDQTEGPDIFIRSGDDITLQAKDTSLGSEREGGDINILAGDGADDDGLGNTASSGGDIILDAGRGGDGNTSSGSAGGFTQIKGGTGGTAGVANLAGGGGYVEIVGGNGGSDNGNTQLGGSGGDVNIYGGDTTREGFNGADVNLTSGAGGPNAFAGSVNISTPSSDSGPGGLWQFDGAGNLVLPRGGVVYETGIPFGGLEGNTIALKPAGGTNADQQLLVYPTAGQDFNHLHLTSGNLYNAELFLGDDNFYVKLANTGNIVINTNDSVGNTYQLNITPFGEVLTTGDLFIQTPNGVPNNVTAITGSSGSWESNPVTNLATTNGTGAGLTVNVTQTGGYASAITIVTPGSGYANGDIITVTSGSSSATFTISVLNNQWILDTQGELTLPTLSLGSGLNEQTVIRSQRKLIPPFHWSAVIDGATPTVVYNATSIDTTSIKVTMQIQHTGLGFEMFEVFATSTGGDTYYTVGSRVAPPTIDASTVVVGLGAGNVMKITVTINSGATTSWVTYDAVEFGIPND